MKNKAPVIELDKLVKRYDDTVVVNSVSLSVHSGECLLLAGHNGAGKTTLMKLMLGLTRPTRGEVRVLGDNPALTSSAAGRSHLGFLPESVAFPQAMSGREVLKFYANLNGTAASHCQYLLERVGLEAAADNRVQTYSKGMRQRLGLAQALLGDPQLLLLDEPTTGLDPSLRQHFYEIIGDMKDKGITTLICSHALNAFEARVDRIAIMKQGSLVACGTLAELTHQATLPVKVKIAAAAGQSAMLAERLGDGAGIRHVNSKSVDLECLQSAKMAMFKRISELGELVEDIEISPPRLDDIYNFYMLDKGQEPPR
jgi:Cu-processing system ATP-binding protein